LTKPDKAIFLTLSHKLNFIQKELIALSFAEDDLISLMKITKVRSKYEVFVFMG